MRIVSLSLMSVMFWTGVAVAQTAEPVVPKGTVMEAEEHAITRQLNTDVHVQDRAHDAARD